MCNEICNSVLCSHLKWVSTLLYCISKCPGCTSGISSTSYQAIPQLFHRCLTLKTVLLFLVSVLTTSTAADCEEPTHEEPRPTRLESRGYSRCDSDTQAPNMSQAGMHYSESETHLHTKQGAPESCLEGNTEARGESVALPQHCHVEDVPKLPQKLVKPALKYKSWAPKILKSAVPCACLQDKQIVRAATRNRLKQLKSLGAPPCCWVLEGSQDDGAAAELSFFLHVFACGSHLNLWLKQSACPGLSCDPLPPQTAPVLQRNGWQEPIACGPKIVKSWLLLFFPPPASLTWRRQKPRSEPSTGGREAGSVLQASNAAAVSRWWQPSPIPHHSPTAAFAFQNVLGTEQIEPRGTGKLQTPLTAKAPAAPGGVSPSLILMKCPNLSLIPCGYISSFPSN